MVILPTLLPDCDFKSGSIVGLTIPTSTRPTIRGFLSLFYMETYSLIEFPICGSETGPLTLFADLGKRHFFGTIL